MDATGYILVDLGQVKESATPKPNPRTLQQHTVKLHCDLVLMLLLAFTYLDLVLFIFTCMLRCNKRNSDLYLSRG